MACDLLSKDASGMGFVKCFPTGHRPYFMF